jgi:hypothetical protein
MSLLSITSKFLVMAVLGHDIKYLVYCLYEATSFLTIDYKFSQSYSLFE